jgi:aminoglycoside phosphotransferase family enzyme
MSPHDAPSGLVAAADPARLRFLQSPAAHRGHAGTVAAVETVETHMSWVFLVGDHVLKLKKPVRYPFLDFSTLAAREADCREELRLNARLAPDVYLGLMALQQQDGGLALLPESALPAPGRTVDWLVLMRRLPAARMLDRLIASGGATPGQVDALARVLADFYRRAPTAGVTPAEHLARLQREQAVNRQVLLHPACGLPGAAAALDAMDTALAQHAPLLLARAAGGHVVDGHGDLRPEHVCLQQPPVVIDALEFNAALRAVDPFDELSFLGLECEMAGAPWIGPRLLAACAAALGHAPPAALLHLYTAYRAQLRARLALAHLLEPEPRTPLKWPPLAQRYLQRSLAALEPMRRPAAPPRTLPGSNAGPSNGPTAC